MSIDDTPRPEGETDAGTDPAAEAATDATDGEAEPATEAASGPGGEPQGDAPTASETDPDAPAEPEPERAARPAARAPDPGPGEGERIAKVLARAGVASRRDCERLIVEGRVRLNGAVVASPAVNVMPSDRLAVDGRPVAEAEATRLWLYHKPAGLVTTERDEEGRPTVFDSLPEDLPRVMSVGRLDITSEGLLILTNDGEIKRRLELPSTGWLRRYRVRVNGALSEAELGELRGGITVDGFDYEPMEVEFDRQQGANAWLTVALREGKNREIRRVMEHLGVQVSRLIRVSYGPFQLGNLEAGAVEEVRPKVVRDQLGLGGTTAATRRVRRKGEAQDPGPVRVETPDRAALATRLPAGAVKRSLKLRAVKVRDADSGQGTARRASKAAPSRPGTGSTVGPMGVRRNRTFMRKDGPRPVTETTEEQAREAARAARTAARDAEASGGRPRSRPDDRGDRPRGDRPVRPAGDRPARPARDGDAPRPRSAGFKTHDRPAREGGEERPRSAGFRSHKGAAEGNERPRAPRREDAEAKGPRTARPDRAPRSDKTARPARFERPAEGERPARRFQARPEGDAPRARPARDGDRPDRPERSQDRTERPRSGPRSDSRPGPASPRAEGSARPPRAEGGRPPRSGPGGGPRPEGGTRGPRSASPRSDSPRTDAPRGDRPRTGGAPAGAPRGAGGPRGGKPPAGKPSGGPRKGPPRGGAPAGRKPRKD